MFLRNLKLINQVDNYILQDCDFHLGVNFVVDADSSKKHNKVGKTTFLKLIDVAMGAQDRKGLYYDASLNNENPELENYIHTNRTEVLLKLVDNLDSPQIEHELKVGLYRGGRYHIDGQKVSQQEYRQLLKFFLFNSNEKNPSFRQLINSFVRISMTGDVDSFLRNLPRAGNATYRAVYNFLFDISDPSLDKKRGDLEHQLKAIIGAEKEFKRVQNTQESSQVEQIITTLENERNQLRQEINDIVNLDEFKKNRSKWLQARSNYRSLTSKLSELQYELDHNQQLIDQIKSDEKIALIVI